MTDCQLKVWLEPDTSFLSEPHELGSDEHPFVWHFEVTHDEDGFVCRGVRETLSEAQSIAQRKALELLPDELEIAHGF